MFNLLMTPDALRESYHVTRANYNWEMNEVSRARRLGAHKLAAHHAGAASLEAKLNGYYAAKLREGNIKL